MDKDLAEMLRLARRLHKRGIVTVVSRVAHQSERSEFFQTVIEVKRSAQFGKAAKDYGRAS